MFKERTELPRCEYPVRPEIYAADMNDDGMCDDPASAKWNWGNGDFFVCEVHDLIVEQQEELTEGWVGE
jgi:hypothetical protein